jgi:RNA polymerase sigma factor (TIGR02999 family)
MPLLRRADDFSKKSPDLLFREMPSQLRISAEKPLACPCRKNLLKIKPLGEVTRILESIEQGDPTAAGELLPLVYEELRKLAAAKMAHETPNQTLQPTALVHEAWLRLVGAENPRFANRAHFFAAAAEAIRRILIDKARRKRALRHGANQPHVDLDHVEIAAPADDDEVLAVNEALDKLAQQNQVEAELVKLRYFVGMTLEEAAQALNISARTADNYWAHAKAWLFNEIKRNRKL